MSHVRVIAGLGNPGSRYEETRHNVGFLLVDELARRHGRSEWRDKFGSRICDASLDEAPVTLVKPQSFMNRSGGPLSEMLGFYKIPTPELVVVHDEIDLPLGTMRIKSGGGDGGHNGIRSIVSALGKDFTRIRLGVGRPQVRGADGRSLGTNGPSVSDWVLGRFGAEEKAQLEAMIERGVEACIELCRSGLIASQNKFNS